MRNARLAALRSAERNYRKALGLVTVLEGRVVGAAAGEEVGEEVKDLFLVQ